MKCPQYGYDNSEGSKFCEQCGVELTRKCPKCGNEVSPTARFCKERGQSLTESATTPSPTKESTTTEPTSFVSDRYKVMG